MWATAKRRARKLLAILAAPVVPHLSNRMRLAATAVVNPRGKLYIPPRLGVAGFFATLERHSVRHVVLRWFEELPHVERGHDLDLLVADEGAETLRGLLSTWPLGQKVDVYSETGGGGLGYKAELLRAVPAFPPLIAAKILASAQRQLGGWCVPAPREHFLGLAFHAVYLKGYDSGLPPDERQPPLKIGSRDYATILTRLAWQCDMTLKTPVTMRSLDQMLDEQGWRPEREHLAALEAVNPWIAGKC